MTCRIVTVEDEEAISDLLEIGLSRQGCTVVAQFASVSEAESWYGWSTVEVAVVDMYMPGHYGSELLAWLKAHYPHVKRIVASAASYRDLEDLERQGLAHAIVRKPFTTAELATTVHALAHEDDDDA